MCTWWTKQLLYFRVKSINNTVINLYTLFYVFGKLSKNIYLCSCFYSNKIHGRFVFTNYCKRSCLNRVMRVRLIVAIANGLGQTVTWATGNYPKGYPRKSFLPVWSFKHTIYHFKRYAITTNLKNKTYSYLVFSKKKQFLEYVNFLKYTPSK